MKFLIYMLELMAIVYYIDKTYGTSNFVYLQSETPNYSSYSYFDVVDNEILDLKNAPEEMKFDIWANSSIQEEVLSYFPHMELMEEVFKDRVEDSGQFKERFLNYMLDLQYDYISGNIDADQFKTKFLSPPDNLKNIN